MFFLFFRCAKGKERQTDALPIFDPKLVRLIFLSHEIKLPVELTHGLGSKTIRNKGMKFVFLVAKNVIKHLLVPPPAPVPTCKR